MSVLPVRNQPPARGAAPVASPVVANASPPAAAPAAPAGDSFQATTPAPLHRDGSVPARDGKPIGYRTTETVEKPQAIVVMQQGTYGKPEFFDGMGEAFAAKGIKSYALGSRVETTETSLHASDLQQVVALARQENPGVPVTVAGVSLGAAIALDWNATHNVDKLPLIAMAPVVMPRYLGLADLGRIALGLTGGQRANARVHSPMSAGRALTTNPQSPELNLADAKSMTVPARLFDDVLKMTLNAAVKGRQTTGPLYVAMGGNDEVGTNWSTRALLKTIGAKAETTRVFPGLAHDLSQEWHDPTLVDALSGFVLQKR